MLDTPVPIETLKLSNIGTGKYLDGRPHGNSRYCRSGFGYIAAWRRADIAETVLTCGGSVLVFILGRASPSSPTYTVASALRWYNFTLITTPKLYFKTAAS